MNFSSASEIYFAPSACKLLSLLFLYFIILYYKFKIKLFKLINFTSASEIYFEPSIFI